MTDADELLWKATAVFAPDGPRQSSDRHTIQASRKNRARLQSSLQQARDHEMPGYYSVYSFPRGHSQQGNIPKVDCIFIDLDVDGNDYVPTHGKTGFDAWRRDMSALLARARMIASAILDQGMEAHFRATLSGHKGLHLYLDFPTISTANGDFQQFKNGLKQYSGDVMEWLDSAAGGVNIDPWVDVDASDLGRLARHPNTINHGAAYDETTRWCVPITISELSELKVEDYLELTEGPRWIDGYQRTPSESAGNKVVQAIRNASGARKSRSSSNSTLNKKLVDYYDRKLDDKWYGDDLSELSQNQRDLIDDLDPENSDIELEDIPFLTANKPCISAFRDGNDSFNHGNASHLMEMSVIARLVDLSVPREVIHDFLSEIPGYEEGYTDEQIDKVIGRDYGEFNCSKIANRAPMFCLGSDCKLYNRSPDIQK